MNKSGIWVAAVLACLATVGTVAADEVFRCGSKIVEIGMTRAEVLNYCGAPTSQSEDVVPVRSANQVVGTTTSYRWMYASFSATRVLVFDQVKLVAIE